MNEPWIIMSPQEFGPFGHQAHVKTLTNPDLFPKWIFDQFAMSVGTRHLRPGIIQAFRLQ